MQGAAPHEITPMPGVHKLLNIGAPVRSDVKPLETKENDMKSDKDKIKDTEVKLIEMTSRYCDEHLDYDYKELCAKMIHKMGRKRNVPFISGKIEIWASAIIYAIGSINFLFDKSFEPFARSEDICAYFGTKKSTTSQKAKIIRDMFNLSYFDSEFSTKHMINNNPLTSFLKL